MSNLRNIPSVDEIIVQADIEKLLKSYRRDFIVNCIREVIEYIRKSLRENNNNDEEIKREIIMEQIIAQVKLSVIKNSQGTLAKVINATGVVLHTNLGRAPLGERAVQYMNEMASNYNNLELDLEKGERGSRYTHVEELLQKICGAEAALVVNNNAAAVLLGLSTLAKGKEVIVSRGQLIEIGGSFRIPEVMKESGAKLVEVGSTNKTYIKDFAEAINEDTALLFSAHTSNYKIVGFTEEVPTKELVELAKQKNLPTMIDLGSGILYNLADWGLKEEPTVVECVNSGADVICFSGDKLLGGPQAGIIVGKKELIDKMKKNQLTRALRVDKLTIAALEGTLLEYLSGDPAKKIPVIKMLSQDLEQLKEKAQELFNELSEKLTSESHVEEINLIELEDMVGGGAYPTYKLKGYGVELMIKGNFLERLSKKLRLMEPAVLARKQDNKLLISVRTLLEGDQQILVRNIKQALQTLKQEE